MLFWKIQSFVHYEILHVLLQGMKYFNHRCDSAAKHSSTSCPLEPRYCELKWLPLSVRKHLMSILLFNPWFYDIGAISCILGTYQLCTKLFFIKGKQCWGNNTCVHLVGWIPCQGTRGNWNKTFIWGDMENKLLLQISSHLKDACKNAKVMLSLQFKLCCYLFPSRFLCF